MPADPLTIHTSDHVIASDAYALIVEGFNDLVQDGHWSALEGRTGVAPTDRTLWLTVDDEPVSVVCYCHDPVVQSYTVTLAYTEPSSRRLGYLKRLWDSLRQAARDEGVATVKILVHPDNKEAIKTINALSGRLTGVRYDFSV